MTKQLLGAVCGTLIAGTLAAHAAPWRSIAIGGGGFVTGLAASTDGSAIYLRTDVGGAYRWDAPQAQWRPITDSLPNDVNNNGHLYGIGAIAVDPSNANRVFIACGKYNYSNPSGVYFCNDTRAENPQWTLIDPTVRVCGNSGFRSSGERLAVDPCNPDVVYFGTYNIGGVGGLRKYVCDGSWSTTTLATPVPGDVDRGISFVAPDPGGGSVSDGTRTVCKRLYIGIYGATDAEGGVFVSDDGGASWTKVTGLTFNKPFRGEVDPSGTLYVTGAGNVAKVARGSTAFTAITPVASLNYTGLAVDPNAAGTVMVAEVLGGERLWRTTDGGGSWVVVNRAAHATEPDGTRSVTSNGKFNNIADILISPGSPDEVWACDFSGVQRTQNIQDDATVSDWYTVQKNHEELVALMLRSAPSGASLLSAVADCNGYAHDDPDVRPSARFNNPSYLSTTGLDFSESSDGKVWARVGDLYYWLGTDADRMGGTSLDGGRTWASFGQLDARSATNSPSAGWETFDVGHYVRRRQATGAPAVTLVLRAGAWQQNHHFLRFSSKEGANPPQLVVNGTTALTPTADATVYKGSTNANYGASAELQAQNYYEQASYTRWSYLRFDLGGVGAITSAVLRVHRMANASDTTAYSAAVHASAVIDWIEGDGGSDANPAGEITWANRPGLLAPPGGQGGRISLSATDPGNLVWLQESGAVWCSKDRGVTWARGMRDGAALTADAMSEFSTSRNALGADRVAADTFYLYAKTGGGTVFRSADGGATWSTLVAGIGSAESYKLLAEPGAAGKFWYVDHNWNVASRFKRWNGASMATVSGIAGVVDFAFGAAGPGRANPAVYARKSDGTYWLSLDATAGETSTWTALDAPPVHCQPTTMEADRRKFGWLYVGTGGRGLFYWTEDAPVTPPSGNGTITWTGQGSGTDWSDAANWDAGVPGPTNTARFTDQGLSSGRVIALASSRTIAKLVIATTTPFTIGAAGDATAGHSLTVTEVERQDVDGTEGLQAFGAPVNLAPDGNGNSLWTIGGEGVLQMNAALGATGATTLVKMGTGSLKLNHKSPTYGGPWRIVEGAVTASGTESMKGNATIGGTTVAARLEQLNKNALFNNMDITVLTNGTFTAGDLDNGRVNSIHAKEGGTATVGTYFYCLHAYLTGGTINGGTCFNGGYTQDLRSEASPIPAVFNCAFKFSDYYDSTLAVEDGTAVIDLTTTKSLYDGGSSSARTLTKSGGGVLRMTGSSGLTTGTFKIAAGTVLADNTSGSATGKSTVKVGNGATLGGIGAIGGVSGSSAANVSLASTSGSSLATLAPGTIDGAKRVHVIGTLTVGSAAQTNNVTFGNHSRLRVTVGGDGGHDRLTVYGALSLATENDHLEVLAHEKVKPGVYTLASATGGISGTFDTAEIPEGTWLTYSATTVECNVPSWASMILMR